MNSGYQGQSADDGDHAGQRHAKLREGNSEICRVRDAFAGEVPGSGNKKNQREEDSGDMRNHTLQSTHALSLGSAGEEHIDILQVPTLAGWFPGTRTIRRLISSTGPRHRF